MKRMLILAAAGVVVAANLWMLTSVSRNRGGAPGGTVELTERELRLSPIPGESTALFLDLKWDVLTVPSGHRRQPRWFDAAKLSALGFDCSMPVTDPGAEEHYRSRMTRPVFVVLEYDGEAFQQTEADRKRRTRLFAVDAGLNPDRLRETYAETNRFIIARGLVRLSFQTHESSGGKPLPQPRLQGRIDSVLPHRVFVPQPHCEELRGLVESDKARRKEWNGEPRFAATISWGTRYEPWVSSVRLRSPSP